MQKVSLFTFLLVVAASCSLLSHDKDAVERNARRKILDCFDKKLRQLKTTDIYKTVFRLADEFYEVAKDTLQTFTQIKVPVSRTLDQYIFFSKDSSYCVLMLLEQYPADFKDGNTRIIVGHKDDDTWRFSLGMHISFSAEDIESLYPDEYKKGMRTYSLTMLSERSRISVLMYTNGSLRGCEFDEKWWLKNQPPQ